MSISKILEAFSHPEWWQGMIEYTSALHANGI